MQKTEDALFRSVRTEQFPQGTIIENQPASGVLYPDFESRELSNGRIRPPDVVLSADGIWVMPGGGTSLFDKANVFKSKGWLMFEIPSGTPVPDSLKIRNTGFNKSFQANHHQIECLTQMRVDAFKGAFDNLARNAVVRSIEQAHQGS